MLRRSSPDEIAPLPPANIARSPCSRLPSGVNWLLVGAFGFDLVATLFGEMSALSRIVYVLVGLAAVYVLVRSPRLVSEA